MPQEALFQLLSAKDIDYEAIENLIFSCEDPKTPIDKQISLSRLFASRDLETGFTLLHKACALGDLRLLRLFLNFGADPELLDSHNKKAEDYICGDEAIRKKMHFTMHLYSHFLKKEALAQGVDWGRILLLVQKALKGMSGDPGAMDQPAVLFFGDTRVGKSTLINYLLGCYYGKNDEGDFFTMNPELERAKVGLDVVSETTYPSVHSIGKYSLVDLAGFRDNRDIMDENGVKPYEVAAGVCMGLLSNRLSQVAHLVLAIEASDISSANLQKVLPSFQSMARFMGAEYETLVPYTTLIITKPDAASQYFAKKPIEFYLQRHYSAFKNLAARDPKNSPRANIILSLLDYFIKNPQKVFIADLSQDKMRHNLDNIFRESSSFQIKKLDFTHYNTQLDMFRQFLMKLDAEKVNVKMFMERQEQKYLSLIDEQKILTVGLQEHIHRQNWDFFGTKLSRAEANNKERQRLQLVLEDLKVRGEMLDGLCGAMDEVRECVVPRMLNLEEDILQNINYRS